MKIDAMLVTVWLVLMIFLSLLFYDFFILLLVLTSAVVPGLALRDVWWWKFMKYSLLSAGFIFLFNFLLSGISGLFFSLSMVLRLLAISSAFAVFSVMVDFETLILLMEKLKFPQKANVSLALSLHYFPVAIEDSVQVRDSLVARGIRPEGRGLREGIKARAPLFSSVFLLSLERSMRVAEALELRGFPSSQRKTWKALEISRRGRIIAFALLIDFFTSLYYAINSLIIVGVFSSLMPLLVLLGVENDKD